MVEEYLAGLRQPWQDARSRHGETNSVDCTYRYTGFMPEQTS